MIHFTILPHAVYSRGKFTKILIEGGVIFHPVSPSIRNNNDEAE